MKIIPLNVLLVLAAIAPVATAQAADAELAECAGISSALDRLDCYDELASRRGSPVTVGTQSASDPVVRPVPGALPEASARPERAVEPPSPPAAPMSVQRVDQGGSASSEKEEFEFGYESLAFELGPESISSRYDGQFTGWTGKTLFRLENGQVWKQTQSGRVSYRRDRPVVTIKKAAFGSYLLSVEGLNKNVRVKRVK